MTPRVAHQPELFAEVESPAGHSRNSTVFADNVSLPVHRWFRFSAGYSGAWATTAIRERFRRSRELCVLDPFVGSGTTLLAAEQAGAARAVGIESHPLMARVAQAKLQWRADPDALLSRAHEVLRVVKPAPPSQSVPALLAKCFPPATLAELKGIQQTCERMSRHEPVDQLLWLALVSILRECSPVGTANWQYVLPNKTKSRVSQPRQAFESKIEDMARDLLVLQSTGSLTTTTFIEGDARICENVEDASVDFVLTSPPYPNNFDYADATRLEMTFLGEIASWGDLQGEVRQHLVRSCSQHMKNYDAESVLNGKSVAPIADALSDVYERLGAVRLQKGGRKAYHWMVVAYFDDLSRTWSALRRVCRPGSRLCLVIGDSAPYGVHVPVEEWLGRLAIAAGFERYRFEKLRDRNHRWLNRKHRVPLHEGRLWVDG